MTLTNVTFTQLASVTKDVGGFWASAWSAAAVAYKDAVNAAAASGVVSELKKQEILARELIPKIEQAAENAKTWADAAKARGEQGVGEIMQKYADKFAQTAAGLGRDLASGEGALSKTIAEANSAIRGAEKVTGSVIGEAAGPIVDAAQMVEGAYQYATTGDTTAFGQACGGVLLGALFGALALVLAPVTIYGAIAVGIASGLGSYFGGSFFDWFKEKSTPFWDSVFGEADKIGRSVSDYFNNAKKPPRRDPLTLDLNGNGLETVGIDTNNPILFDHDGDGIKSATGWVKADDGFLVLDRNGNGMIDNGTELFGDSTPLIAGGKAVDGFAALAQQDTNNDGKVDNQDANFAQLRVWRDLSQDGLSQANELFSLDALNIASINVASTDYSVFLANGNQIADLGSYTKTDGSTGTLGEVGQIADVNLAEDTFNSKFPDHIPLAEGVSALPAMSGSGQVRDIQEAASIDSDAGRELKAKLAAYAAATTRTEQKVLLEGLIEAWGATSSMETSIKISTIQTSYTPWVWSYVPLQPGQGYIPPPDDWQYSSGIKVIEEFAQGNPTVFKRINALEQFVGSNFLDAKIVRTWSTPYGDNGPRGYAVGAEGSQNDYIAAAWGALSDSVYQSFLIQTRFKPLLDQIELIIDANGIHLDVSKINAYFLQLTSTITADSLGDLIDFNRFVAPMLGATDWKGLQLMEQLIRTTPTTPELSAFYASEGVVIGAATPTLTHGRILGDIIVAGNSSDVIIGLEGDDILFGGGAMDKLLGNDGNDTLIGGTGNDLLYGDAGNDTYVFSRGDGRDTLYNFDPIAGRRDVVQLTAGISPNDVVLSISGRELYLTIKGTTDVIIFGDGVNSHGINENYMVNEIRFADGTVWDVAKMTAVVLGGSDTDDLIAGFDSADNITGQAGDDTISGFAGNDVIDGGDGNDYLDGGEGDDTLDGGAGDDEFAGQEGNDTIIWGKGSGNDTIFTNETTGEGSIFGSDVVKIKSGTSPADVKVVRYGQHLTLVIAGGTSLFLNNILLRDKPDVSRVIFEDGTTWDIEQLKMLSFGGNNNAQTINGFAGDDVIHAFGGNDTIYGLDGNDSLFGDDGYDTLYGGAGNDILDAGAGGGYLTGGQGDDVYLWGVGDGQVAILNAGNLPQDIDSLHIKAGMSPVQTIVRNGNIYGIPGFSLAIDHFPANGVSGDGVGVENAMEVRFADGTIWAASSLRDRSLLGSDGKDLIYGFSTDDVINAGDGPDEIRGKLGNDTINGQAGDDFLLGDDGNDIIDGGDGGDGLRGGAGNDVLIGGAGNDYLYGEDGDDTLDGGAGDDHLFGDGGIDTYLWGKGSGKDEISTGEPTTGVKDSLIIKAGLTPTDLVLQKDGQHLIIKVKDTTDELLVYMYFTTDMSLQEIRFTDDTTVWTLAQILDLTRVNRAPVYTNSIDFQVVYERDLLDFVVPENILVDPDVGDVLTYTAMQADGTALPSWLTFDPASRRFTGTAPFVLEGPSPDLLIMVTATDNAGASTGVSFPIYLRTTRYLGTQDADYLNADDNDNTLLSFGGDDTLDGGAGADSMSGGAGNDTYLVENIGDTVIENVNEGIDLVQSSVTYTLNDNVEKLTLLNTTAINATGNALVNTLTGNSGANVLDGGAGVDTMIGGAGNDTYIVDISLDIVTEAANGGTDLVLSSASYTLASNVEKLTLTGTATINGTGNSAVNTITGNSGNNVLDGGAGIDTLIGGAGDDTYVIDTASDIITELANAGTDTVLSAVNYTLGASSNLENLALTGTAATGTGNALANIITGNSAANTLDGGTGIDTLIGGAGNDTYLVDNTSDVVAELASEGTDLVKASVTYTLSANLENLTLTGTTAINGTGNSSINTLTGNTGNNILDGGAGIDTMIGGTGNDTYVVDNTADIVTEAASAGTDLVQSSATYTLSSNVENLTLTGSADINGTGNTVANILIGNAGNNTLNGGTGADAMTGGAGNDIYVVDNAGDVVTEVAAQGSDQVQSSVTYTLNANVEALYLTGTGSINGTGNAIDNLLIGNSGINTLNGAAGNDILQGGAGVDTLIDTLGNNVLDGGAGNDIITAGVGNDFIVGGLGNDTITTGQGADVIAFNRGDGMDIINASTVKDNTLSLGKGITYADLLFKKSGNDLILVTGASEQMTIKDWYLSTANHNIANLQIVIEGTADYNAASASVINNKKIEQFNFDGLVTKFDQARVANPALTSWALSSSLLSFYLAGSDTAAIGGDLAYQYAKNGNLSTFSMMPAQTLLANAQFGAANQALQTPAALIDASPRLM